MKPKWIWVRFLSSESDWRPVRFPPPGPYWCTGYDSNKNAVIVCYVRKLEEVKRNWPEAKKIEFKKDVEINFSKRFPEPAWFNLLCNNL